MLAASPVEQAEECALHDYEGFEGVHLSEYQGVESIVEMAEFIQGNSDLGAQVLAHHCGDLEAAKVAIVDHYAGCYRFVAEFAEEMIEQSGTEVPENLRYYIDYDAMARDMLINDAFTIELARDEVHIFWQY